MEAGKGDEEEYKTKEIKRERRKRLLFMLLPKPSNSITLIILLLLLPLLPLLLVLMRLRVWKNSGRTMPPAWRPFYLLSCNVSRPVLLQPSVQISRISTSKRQ